MPGAYATITVWCVVLAAGMANTHGHSHSAPQATAPVTVLPCPLGAHPTIVSWSWSGAFLAVLVFKRHHSGTLPAALLLPTAQAASPTGFDVRPRPCMFPMMHLAHPCAPLHAL